MQSCLKMLNPFEFFGPYHGKLCFLQPKGELLSIWKLFFCFLYCLAACLHIACCCQISCVQLQSWIYWSKIQSYMYTYILICSSIQTEDNQKADGAAKALGGDDEWTYYSTIKPLCISEEVIWLAIWVGGVWCTLGSWMIFFSSSFTLVKRVWLWNWSPENVKNVGSCVPFALFPGSHSSSFEELTMLL